MAPRSNRTRPGKRALTLKDLLRHTLENFKGTIWIFPSESAHAELLKLAVAEGYCTVEKKPDPHNQTRHRLYYTVTDQGRDYVKV